MNVEFIDTNILIYAHNAKSGAKHNRSVELISQLTNDDHGALSLQVLYEFYATATRKLGMVSEQAEAVILDFGIWRVHRPAHPDLVRAVRLHRRDRDEGVDRPWHAARISGTDHQSVVQLRDRGEKTALDRFQRRRSGRRVRDDGAARGRPVRVDRIGRLRRLAREQ